MTESLNLILPIRDDLLSGAAEMALKAITIFQRVLNEEEPGSTRSVQQIKQDLTAIANALVEAQPAMAPIFHLSNQVLLGIQDIDNKELLYRKCQDILNTVEKNLCENVAQIVDYAFDLIPPGELIFAYSFSSTVMSCLLNARSKGRYFRVVCSESRPSMEGRKLSARLAAGGIEVTHTFDSAMGLVLPNCSVAFMGCDCAGPPGVVNKAGSLLLALACKEMSIPLYAISSTDKFVSVERLFEFENHERPGSELWDDPPKGVKVLNHQFELIPFKYITALVTEKGILSEKELSPYFGALPVHPSLQLEPAKF